ncbi:hypothetical protein [Enterococcus hirae]|uniref:hypothetical protein n=1 Tax=Enterococcus hirae TaxID=1354 RepID=UPI0032E3A916
MKKLTNVLLVSSILLGGFGIGTMNASAETVKDNELGWIPGLSDPEDDSVTIQGEDNAQIKVDGWIGPWDPVGPEDVSYVDITVPTKVRYANAVTDDGQPLPNILSPIYTVTNNSSARRVKIEISKFEEKSQSGVRQDLYFTPTNEAGVRLQSVAGQFLNSPTYLTELDKSSSKTLKFEGKIAEGFKENQVVRTSYEITFNFTALKDTES